MSDQGDRQRQLQAAEARERDLATRLGQDGLSWTETNELAELRRWIAAEQAALAQRKEQT